MFPFLRHPGLSLILIPSLLFPVLLCGECQRHPCCDMWASRTLKGDIKVQSGGSFDIDFDVKDPRDVVILDGKQERQGDYILTANHVGEYAFCFENDMSTITEKLIDFDIMVSGLSPITLLLIPFRCMHYRWKVSRGRKPQGSLHSYPSIPMLWRRVSSSSPAC